MDCSKLGAPQRNLGESKFYPSSTVFLTQKKSPEILDRFDWIGSYSRVLLVGMKLNLLMHVLFYGKYITLPRGFVHHPPFIHFLQCMNIGGDTVDFLTSIHILHVKSMRVPPWASYINSIMYET